MTLVAALIYWIIVALWLLVLTAVAVAFSQNRRTFGTVRLLLFVIVIDTIRNVVENSYFGLYFGSLYGLFPAQIAELLGRPNFLIAPKIVNVFAACAVFGILFLRWLPLAFKERAKLAADVDQKTQALNQETEERRRLFETSLDLIFITDGNGVLRQVSPSANTTLGYQPDEMVGRSAAEFIEPADVDLTQQELRLARTAKLTRNFEARFVHKNGMVVPLAWSGIWSEAEQKCLFVGRDITERRAAEQQLQRLAHFDPLTGLPNRVSLYRDVDATLTDYSPAPLSMAAFDLDGFKDINDTLGHAVGDRLLQEVAVRLSAHAKGFRLYRSGEDEFVLLAQNCADPVQMASITDSILKHLMAPFEFEGHSLFVAASAGIAMAPGHGSKADELFGNAELALYDAKAAGGRSYRLYVPSLRARVRQRCELDAQLRSACEREEFILHFQPQVRADDFMIAGAEALLRWHHPKQGILQPGAFIGALCESSAATEAGRWILTEACKTAAAWREKRLPPFRMGVNLFPAQFRNRTLLDDVERALAESGLPAEFLELEITENIALACEDATLCALRGLRKRGVQIAFDDFGTGYASLSHLTRYPLTRIKIDRSFIQKIDARCAPEDAAIVRSIIAMGRNLGIEVTAEGVETQTQASFLRAEGCHELQGYLFSQPLPPDTFELFVRSRASAASEPDVAERGTERYENSARSRRTAQTA